MCPEKLKQPRDQNSSITLPPSWVAPASLGRHYHLVNTLCIGFPGKPQSSVRGNYNPSHVPHAPQCGAGTPVLQMGGPVLVLPAADKTFPAWASLSPCSVRLWLARGTPLGLQDLETLPSSDSVCPVLQLSLHSRARGAARALPWKCLHVCQPPRLLSSGVRAADSGLRLNVVLNASHLFRYILPGP